VHETAAEPAVTEIGAGSGRYQPALIDSHRAEPRRAYLPRRSARYTT
jgi:hypothetical protein